MRKKITLVIRIRKKPEAEFPRFLRDKVYQTVGEGSKFSLVIRKKLTNTDLNEHHSRLSIPLTKIAGEFLTDEEKTRLSKPADHHKIRIEVFLDSDMEKVTEDVYLTTWQQGKRYMYYVVGKGWIKLAKRLNLIEGDEVELWSFRSITGSLCFVLLTVEARTAAAVADKELCQ
ncbi:Putative B3 domain-containing protein At3g49610 [Linum grandiflorum]